MYQQYIREELAKTGNLGYDPRHIEAFMRLEHSTLDGLSPSRFRTEVLIGVECVNHCGETESESLAKSFGL